MTKKIWKYKLCKRYHRAGVSMSAERFEELRADDIYAKLREELGRRKSREISDALQGYL